MTFEQSITRPPRCTLVNVTTGETIDCWFNPEQLSVKVQVSWNRLVVPGLSHQPLQYQSTGNRRLDGVEFHVNRLFAIEQTASADIADFRNFIRALTVPPKALEGVPSSAPPRTLLVWPGVLTIETVVTDVEFRYQQFAGDGSLLVYTAICGFEEILDLRTTSEARRQGD